MAAKVTQFWLKVTALIAPVFIPLALPVAVMWRTGEFATADAVADRIIRGERGVRYSQACSDQWQRFKLRMAASQSPDVLVIGGSSSLQFRSGFFQKTFYNAAGTIKSLWHAKAFLESIGPRHPPKMLVLGLHPYLFLQSWQPGSRLARDFDPPPPSVLSLVQSCSDRVAGHLLDHSIPINVIAHPPSENVGLQGLLGSPGFRIDGSYERSAPPPIPDRFAGQVADARTGSHYLPFGDEFAPSHVAELHELLGYCRASGIHVVAYFPPVADAVRDVMLTSGNYAYVFHAFERLTPIFDEYGFILFDATDVRAIGASDQEMLDATHPSERADLRLLLHLAARDSMLASYVGIPRLKRLLANSGELSVLDK